MRIAIFGDSWGDNRPSYLLQPEACWVDILQQKYNITNFAEAGSSLFFSASLFKDNYLIFDKVIFLVTDRNRIYLPQHAQLHESSDRYTRHASLRSIDIFKLNNAENYRNNAEILKAIDYYYRFICNDNSNEYFYQLIVKDICSRMNSNQLLVLERLILITQKEERYYRNLGFDCGRYEENKNCHMTDTNNKRMAELVEQWIDDGTTKLTLNNSNVIDERLFYDPINEPFEKYYHGRESYNGGQ